MCLGLVAVAFGISAALCAAARRVGGRAGLLDRAGSEAHKAHGRAVPNTGGVGIAWAVLLPLGALLVAAWVVDPSDPLRAELADGLRSVSGGAGVLIGALLLMHVVGLIDDRRPLPAGLKLAAQFLAAAALVVGADMRVLQVLDDALPGGYAVSVAISVLWIVVITNAFNMLDNMDGLSAGVGAIASAIFLAAALLSAQWFVAGAAGLLLGALLGFLLFNFPPASLFMGDGGSLVLGMLLAVIAMRVTYVQWHPEGVDAGWSEEFRGFRGGVLAPLVVLAVPLYDFVSVVLIRLRQGRRPWVGDTQHFSHRLLLLGLSRRRAVGVIYLATAATGLGGVTMARAEPWQAVLITAGAMSVLAMIALLEHGSAKGRRGA